ncbi:MAG: hypothetical protein IPG92_17645 [Flavobacteriales bacterium]|nr:hypothetical protein [Flavobacteriales bacterium]
MSFWNALFSGEVDTTFYLQAPAERFDHIATIGPHAIDRDFDYYQRYHAVWRIDGHDRIPSTTLPRSRIRGSHEHCVMAGEW